MADVYKWPDMETAEREASEWIARLNADDVCAEDRARFEAWRAAHPHHARAYDALAGTWQRFTEAGRIARTVSFGQSLNAASEDVLKPRRARGLPVLAAAFVLMVIGALVWVARPTPETSFQTAIGEHAAVALPDGSSLELNSNSRVRVDYSEHARVIRLERGEAYFDVAHEAQRPFWVVAGKSWVRAVGTAFNVHLQPSGVRVIVNEGTVKVAAAPADVLMPSDAVLKQAAVSVLTAGQQADVRGGSAEIRSLAEAELARSVAWRAGTLYFENQPLGEVVAELSRYTTFEIVVRDVSVQQMPVGGAFEATARGAEALLAMLEDGFDLHIERDGSKRVVVKAQ